MKWGSCIEISGELLSLTLNHGSPPTEAQKRSYEVDVFNVLDEVYGNQVGEIILDSIKSSGQTIWIYPLLRVNAISNAMGFPGTTADGRNLVNGTVNGVPQMVCEAPKPSSDSVLRYTPETWRSVDSTVGLNRATDLVEPVGFPGVHRALDQGNNLNPDDVLLHELVHMSRYIRGLSCKIPMAMGFENVAMAEDKVQYGDREEFIAITITNMYRSRRAGPANPVTLRGDHDLEFHELESHYYNDQWFATNYAAEIDFFRIDMPDVFESLANVDCEWNPFR